MTTKELQNSIIQKVLYTDDDQLLDYLNTLLSEGDENKIYQLSDLEKVLISESQADYKSGKIISNEDIISRNEEWLKLPLRQTLNCFNSLYSCYILRSTLTGMEYSQYYFFSLVSSHCSKSIKKPRPLSKRGF